MNHYPNFADGDSGVPMSSSIPAEFPTFTSPMIERWNEMQVQNEPPQAPRSMSCDEVANEIFSRLLAIGGKEENTKRDRIAALEGAWRVYADYARLTTDN